MEAGSLQEVPIAPLLLAQAVHRRTGVLEIRRRQVWKRIAFDHGVPVDCRSNLAHETLGRYMVIEGKLSDENFTASLGRAASRGVPLGEELLERGLVTPDDLFRIQQANLAKKLLDLFTWREGDFQTDGDLPTAESSLKIKVPQLILTGVTKLAPQEEVDMAVGPLVGQRLCLHPSPPIPLDEIRLSQRQSQLVEAARPGRRMGEIAQATGLSVDEISRLLYALMVLGLIVPESRLPKSSLSSTGSFRAPILKTPPPTTAATQPVPIIQQTPAVDPGETERRRNDVMQAYLVYRRQDAFDLLGVPEGAVYPNVRLAPDRPVGQS